MSTLVWIEMEQGRARRVSLDVLERLAASGGGNELWAVMAEAASGLEDGGSSALVPGLVPGLVSNLALELAAHGASGVLALRLPLAGESAAQGTQGEDALPLPPDVLADALVWLVRTRQEEADAAPLTFVAAGTAAGRDLLARVAAGLDAPLLQDCLSVDPASGEALKFLFSGRATARYAMSGPVRLYGLRPGAGAHGEKSAGSASAREGAFPIRSYTPPVSGSRMRVLERVRESGEADLQEASILVAGGRPVGAEGFQLLQACSAALATSGTGKGGAAVAASRSAVDLGFAPPALQVGQTGQVVSPDLYVACGISGSVYHTVGIRTAGAVVCINTDPGAPMFGRADYGLTDDLFVALPLLAGLVRSGS